jgi:ubiquinone/menaquinone biosynthesis C-methylase UbiE
MTDSEVTSKAAENLPAHGITSRHSTGTRGFDVADALGHLAAPGAPGAPAAPGAPGPPGADLRPNGTEQPTSPPPNPEARSVAEAARSAVAAARNAAEAARSAAAAARSSVAEARKSAGLEKVTAAVVASARVQPGDRVIDLGCGSGPVSLELAERGAHVLAIDADLARVGELNQIARTRSLPELEVVARPLDSLALPVRSADLIVTSYAMHRLRDPDKQRLIAAAYHWLRPGGTLIVADMMFGRGTSSQDRAIIKSKVRSLARKGIGGWWRIVKNSYRFLVQVKEHPVSISAWTAIFARAGFTGITASRVVNEAGLVLGRRSLDEPAPDPQSAAGSPGCA